MFRATTTLLKKLLTPKQTAINLTVWLGTLPAMVASIPPTPTNYCTKNDVSKLFFSFHNGIEKYSAYIYDCLSPSSYDIFAELIHKGSCGINLLSTAFEVSEKNLISVCSDYIRFLPALTNSNTTLSPELECLIASTNYQCAESNQLSNIGLAFGFGGLCTASIIGTYCTLKRRRERRQEVNAHVAAIEAHYIEIPQMPREAKTPAQPAIITKNETQYQKLLALSQELEGELKQQDESLPDHTTLTAQLESTKSSLDEISKKYTCPVTYQIMDTPVFLGDDLYEQYSLLKMLKESKEGVARAPMGQRGPFKECPPAALTLQIQIKKNLSAIDSTLESIKVALAANKENLRPQNSLQM